jgi:hypothetical protein
MGANNGGNHFSRTASGNKGIDNGSNAHGSPPKER